MRRVGTISRIKWHLSWHWHAWHLVRSVRIRRIARHWSRIRVLACYSHAWPAITRLMIPVVTGLMVPAITGLMVIKQARHLASIAWLIKIWPGIPRLLRGNGGRSLPGCILPKLLLRVNRQICVYKCILSPDLALHLLLLLSTRARFRRRIGIVCAHDFYFLSGFSPCCFKHFTAISSQAPSTTANILCI